MKNDNQDRRGPRREGAQGNSGNRRSANSSDSRSGGSRNTYGKRSSERSGGRSFGKGGERSFRGQGDRPNRDSNAGQREFRGDREKRDFKGGDREFRGDRQKRDFKGGDREFRGDRQKRDFNGGDREFRGDRQKRDFKGGDREFRGDRQKRDFKGGDREFRGDRQKRDFKGGERSFRSQDSRPSRDGNRGGRKSYGEGNRDNTKRSFGWKKEGESQRGQRGSSRFNQDDDKRRDPRPANDTRRSFDSSRSNSTPNPSDAENRFGGNAGGRKRMARKPNYDPAKISEAAKLKGKKVDTNAPKETRLNKFIANAGICSRREADERIANGEVAVNGKVVTEMGHKVKAGDTVKYQGKELSGEAPLYILLNKPKDFITTTKDPQERKTVMELVGGAGSERIFPVGRLDRATTGLLLFTNDGDLAEKLTHPSHKVQKLYEITLDRPIERADFVKLESGITLEDGLAKPVDVAIVGGGDDRVLGMEIHMGRNRIVRRMFEHLGYQVEKLDRVMYAGLTKKDVKRGQWRYLTEKEVVKLKYFL